MRVAIVHDWLYVLGGAERVLKELLKCYPQAQVFTLFDVLSDEQRALIGFRKVTDQFSPAGSGHRENPPRTASADAARHRAAGSLGLRSGHFEQLRGGQGCNHRPRPGACRLCPLADALRLGPAASIPKGKQRAFRAQGAIGAAYAPSDPHLGYAPPAFGQTPLSLIRLMSPGGSGRPSAATQRSYTLPSIPPRKPRDCPARTTSSRPRLVGYKNTRAIVEAFKLMPEQKLVVAGSGPEAKSLRAIAGPNVIFKETVSDAEMRRLMATAQALIFAAEEDFGIVPVEAQAEGTPVLALERGGARETVIAHGPGQTGMFFKTPEPYCIAACVNAFVACQSVFSRESCQAHASNFASKRFRQQFKSLARRELERVNMEIHFIPGGAGPPAAAARIGRVDGHELRPCKFGPPCPAQDRCGNRPARPDLAAPPHVQAGLFTNSASGAGSNPAFVPRLLRGGHRRYRQPRPASSSASAAWIEKLGDPADLESQLQIIQSRRMLRLALARPGVIDAVIEECRHRGGAAALFRRGTDCSKLTPNSQELVDHAEAHYTVRGVGRSRIISIGYQSPLPDVSFVLANALIVTYLEDQRAENARAREVTAAWLLKEGKQEAALASAESEGTAGGPDTASAQSRQKFYQDLYSKAADLETERRVLLGGGRL